MSRERLECPSPPEKPQCREGWAGLQWSSALQLLAAANQQGLRLSCNHRHDRLLNPKPLNPRGLSCPGTPKALARPEGFEVALLADRALAFHPGLLLCGSWVLSLILCVKIVLAKVVSILKGRGELLVCRIGRLQQKSRDLLGLSSRTRPTRLEGEGMKSPWKTCLVRTIIRSSRVGPRQCEHARALPQTLNLGS